MCDMIEMKLRASSFINYTARRRENALEPPMRLLSLEAASNAYVYIV